MQLIIKAVAYEDLHNNNLRKSVETLGKQIDAERLNFSYFHGRNINPPFHLSKSAMMM